ncbi:MAG: hypothetical protein DWQ42_14955 [Planctomycetota bacterium]|nr:MAG: hypothetical protein DWQ42_14955 [Planctomycetota bacterium]REK47642.1 MAG: hypothetical protein DWQ46_04235 [Planctomycetota bacterium]
MNDPRPPITDPDKVSEQITAYLDGELSADDRREIEDRLTRDEQFRAQVRGEQQAWDLLDELPRTQAGDRFAATTIEMVAVDAERDHTPRHSLRPRPARSTMLFAIGMITLFFTGFAVVTAIGELFDGTGTVAEENDLLLHLLPVIQRSEVYRHVDDLEFLRQLAAEGLFAGDSAKVEDGVVAQESTAVANVDFRVLDLEARRAAVEDLDANQAEALQRLRRNFENLAPQKQQQVIDFHATLTDDEDRDALDAIAVAYSRWLSKRDWELRLALKSLPPPERIAEIRRHLQPERQRPPKGKRIEADIRRLFRWACSFAEEHREEVLASLAEHERRRIAGSTRRLGPWLLGQTMLRHWLIAGEPREPELDQASFERLLEVLSPSVRKHVASSSEESVERRWRELWRALQERFADQLPPEQRDEFERLPAPARWSRMLSRANPFRHNGGTLSEKQLLRAFADLPPQRQAELEGLPRKELLRQLQREVRHQLIEDPAALDGPPRRHRPGPRPPRLGPPRGRDDEFRKHRRPPPGDAEFDRPPPGDDDRSFERPRPNESDRDDRFRPPPPRPRDRPSREE